MDWMLDETPEEQRRTIEKEFWSRHHVEEAENYNYSEHELAVLEANPRHIIKGTPQTVKEELMEMVEKYGVDELMIVTITYDFEARCRSYELLAEVWAE